MITNNWVDFVHLEEEVEASITTKPDIKTYQTDGSIGYIKNG
jgi:hypothetical protein